MSSARLFGGAWRLLPVVEHREVRLGDGTGTITMMIDLADGRGIGALRRYGEEPTHWVACRVERIDERDPIVREYRLVDDPADIPVYGGSLAFLLDAALDSGGDIDHLRTGWLGEASLAKCSVGEHFSPEDGG